MKKLKSPKKIVVIGAGSASFGLNTLGSIMKSEKLKGCEIALIDRNSDNLARMTLLAKRVNRDWDCEMKISSYIHHKDALPGAEFVISAIEVPPREKLWRQDWEIPLKYGVRQPYGENGGPGGFAHAARNIGPLLEIAHDMEQACPAAWYINFSNPMVRICDALNRYSKIKVIGLCHQIHAAYGMVGYVMADELGIMLSPGKFSTHADPKYWDNLKDIAQQAERVVDIKAAGLNHFTWIVDIRDKRTGDDLYPALRNAWRRADPSIEPLTQRVFEAFGLMPVPGDEHLDEYLSWCSDPLTRPWEKYDLELYDWDAAEAARGLDHLHIDRMGRGEESIESLKETDSEGATEVVEALSLSLNEYHIAANLPNTGQISNLPIGAIVETPVLFNWHGCSTHCYGFITRGNQ